MKPKESINNHRRGYLYVVLAALMWGLSGSSAKFLFNSGITPFQLVQMRLTISAVFEHAAVLLLKLNQILLQDGFIEKFLERAGFREELDVFQPFIQKTIDVLRVLMNHFIEMGVYFLMVGDVELLQDNAADQEHRRE